MPHDALAIKVFVCGMVLVFYGIVIIIWIAKDWNKDQ